MVVLQQYSEHVPKVLTLFCLLLIFYFLVCLLVSSIAYNGAIQSTYSTGIYFLLQMLITLVLLVSKDQDTFYWQSVLQELGKQNPNLLTLIRDHHAEFLQLINEPVEGSEG